MPRDVLIDPTNVPKHAAAKLRKHQARLERAAERQRSEDVRFAVTIRTEQGEEEVLLPPSLTRAFAAALVEVAGGHVVQVSSVTEALTTGEAAALLKVSRPYLVKLLEDGTMPHWKVGAHRRVRRADVLAYAEDQQRRSEEALQALADQAQELGLGYD